VTTDYSVKVAITADTSAYTAGVRKAQQGTDQLGASAKKNTGLVQRFGTQMTVAGTAGLVALGALAKASVDAASNLAESQSKVGVVFGDSADEIRAWAKDSARAFGQSEQQALEAAGTFGNLFTAMGITGDKAQDMSTSMVELAADLASFNNIGVDEALEKIRAGLVGEAEPLRTLGVNLSAATIEAEAMALGLGAAGKELTAAEKAQGAYSLILKQTTTAQGDFARTSDGLANQQRIHAAEFENAKASLGQSLLPVMTEVTGVASDLLAGFAQLPKGVQTSTLALAALGAGLLILLPRIAATTAAIETMGGAAAVTARTLKATGIGAILLVGAAATQSALEMADLRAEFRGLDKDAKALATDQLAQQLYDWEAGIQGVGDAASKFTQVLGLVGDSLLTGSNAFADHERAMRDAAAQYERSADLAMGHSQAISDVAWETGLTVKQIEELASSLDLEGKTFLEEKDAIRGAVREKREGTVASQALGDATATLADEVANAEDKVKAYKDAIDGLAGGVLDVSEAESDWFDALSSAKEVLKENYGAVKLSTEAGRANLDVLAQLREGAIDHAAAVYQQTGDLGKANAVLGAHRQKLYETAAQYGINREAVDALIGKIEDIPPAATTKVTADTKSAADAIEAFRRRVLSRPLILNAKVTTGGLSVPGQQRASGGYITGPGTGTSDSIPAWLSNGEFVIRASSVDKYGTDMLHAINAGRFAAGGLVGGRAVSGRAGGTSYAVTVNVGGSVVAERDLVRAVRDGLQVMSGRGDAA